MANLSRIAYALCRSNVRRGSFFSFFVLFSLLTACSDPPPPKSAAAAAAKSDTVPVNSISDARMKGEEDPQDRAAREAAKKNDTAASTDPSKPYTTKVGEPAPSSSSSSAPTGKGVVSKAECDRVMDKYLELEIASNPQLKGVPPDVIEAAKQMAREKHGDSPCTASKTQYNCAMMAASPATWQKCMK